MVKPYMATVLLKPGFNGMMSQSKVNHSILIVHATNAQVFAARSSLIGQRKLKIFLGRMTIILMCLDSILQIWLKEWKKCSPRTRLLLVFLSCPLKGLLSLSPYPISLYVAVKTIPPYSLTYGYISCSHPMALSVATPHSLILQITLYKAHTP
jgi:hypothetical protein